MDRSSYFTCYSKRLQAAGNATHNPRGIPAWSRPCFKGKEESDVGYGLAPGPPVARGPPAVGVRAGGSPARSAPPTPIGGRGAARAGPAAGRLPLQQRRLQVFIPTVREEPTPPPTKSKTRKEQIVPAINASQKRFQFNPAENRLHLQGLRSYSTEITQTRASSLASQKERCTIHPSTRLPGHHLKKCTVAVESPASSLWRPPGAQPPKVHGDQLRQRARPARGSGPEDPPHAHDRRQIRAPFRSASWKIKTGERWLGRASATTPLLGIDSQRQHPQPPCGEGRRGEPPPPPRCRPRRDPGCRAARRGAARPRTRA